METYRIRVKEIVYYEVEQQANSLKEARDKLQDAIDQREDLEVYELYGKGLALVEDTSMKSCLNPKHLARWTDATLLPPLPVIRVVSHQSTHDAYLVWPHNLDEFDRWAEEQFGPSAYCWTMENKEQLNAPS
jgi:hypothetical protein